MHPMKHLRTADATAVRMVLRRLLVSAALIGAGLFIADVVTHGWGQ